MVFSVILFGLFIFVAIMLLFIQCGSSFLYCNCWFITYSVNFALKNGLIARFRICFYSWNPLIVHYVYVMRLFAWCSVSVCTIGCRVSSWDICCSFSFIKMCVCIFLIINLFLVHMLYISCILIISFWLSSVWIVLFLCY